MTDDLVGRIAKALCNHQRHLPEDPTWENTCARDLYEGEARACLAEIAAAGRSIVPNEPTGAMLAAGRHPIIMNFVEEADAFGVALTIYRAMLAASRKV